jgi:hypothetical protein
MTSFGEILNDIARDLKQIQKRLDDVELTGVPAASGTVPAAGTLYNHLEDNGAAWISVTNLTMADGASIRSPAGPVVLFDDTGNNLQISGCDVLVDPGGALAAPDGTLHVHTATAGAVTAWGSADDLVVENSGDGGISILTPATSVGVLAFGSPTSNLRGRIQYNHNVDEMQFIIAGTNDWEMRNQVLEAQPGSVLDLNGNTDAFILDADGDTTISAPTDDQMDFEVGGSDRLIITNTYANFATGPVFINETANANMDIGLTIDQAAYDSEALNIRSSDVGAVNSTVETGTYLRIQKYQGSSGGVDILGLKDADGTNAGALRLIGNLEEDTNTTKTTAARAIVEVYGLQYDGTSVENTVANGNVLALRTYRGGAFVTTLIVDEDADMNLPSGRIATGHGDYWDLEDYHAGAPTADGYVRVDINGTTYELLANLP